MQPEQHAALLAVQEMENRLAVMTQQVSHLQREVAHLRRTLLPPRMPWRLCLRHRVKCLLGLHTHLGRLQFDESPRPVYVPRRYHRRPRLINPPVISIVTPSYNQGQYLPAAVESVLSQDYPRLEYVIQDGGSTDTTGQVLDRYRARLHHCEMRKDNGQSHALNLGFAHTSGEVMAYLNSDDLLLPGSLWAVARYFERHPNVDVVYGHRVIINEKGEETGRWVLPPHDGEVLRWADYIPQETLFWRRRIWEKAGGQIDESFRFAMDWDLLLRLQEAGARFQRLPRFLGAFRVHDVSKTVSSINNTGALEMERLRERCHGRAVTGEEIQAAIRKYMRTHRLYNRLYQLGLFRY